MKYFVHLLFVPILSFCQCVVDINQTSFIADPTGSYDVQIIDNMLSLNLSSGYDTLTAFPDAFIGQNYEAVVGIRVPTDTSFVYDLGSGPTLFEDVQIVSIGINSVVVSESTNGLTSLPAGFSWDCVGGDGSSNCSWSGGDYGCIRFGFDSPIESGLAGAYRLTVNLDVSATYEIFGAPIPVALVEETLLNYYVLVISDEPPFFGCTDENAINYNPNANSDDGSCLILGCTDSNYLEFNLAATQDDGSCENLIIYGCVDVVACNYNPNANSGDQSCEYIINGCDECLDLNNDGIPDVINNDTDNDGVCNEDEIFGCIYSSACNYNPNATEFDGSCVYTSNNCDLCEDINGDGIPEVIENDTDGDGICNEFDIPGCTNTDDCNYNLNATEYDGSCVCLFEDIVLNICYTTIENNSVNLFWNNFTGTCDISVLEQTAPNTWTTFEVSESFDCDFYNIYRENQFGNYVWLNSVQSFDNNLSYVDDSANPAQQSYSYLITTFDDCGNETIINEIDRHKTIHLSSNQGLSGEVNLIWNSYEGFNYNVFDIWRNNNGSGYELIGQVSTDNFTYSDVNPPSGQNQYFISVTQLDECSTFEDGRLALNTSSSNTLDLNALVSINEENYRRKLIYTTGVLGKENTIQKGFQLHIYDDGSVEKKYVIK